MVYIAPVDDIDMERTILHLKIIKLNKTIEELQQERDALRKVLVSCKRGHYYCEDTWYSCPMHEEGCANEAEKGCTCGADEWNAAIDTAIAEKI